MNNKQLNNPIWVMSSAFDQLNLDQLIEKTLEVGAQGIDLCAFRKDGTREDHTATHIEYEDFGPEEAKRLINQFNEKKLGVSLGAFENMIGGDEAERIKNQNHLLKLIRIAYLLGGDENNVKVGTFIGYNHELGNQENGFQKNLDEYYRVFNPIIKYAEDLGVTVVYENCPMEGWSEPGFTNTYNNLPGVLAARKLIYAMIPSKAHGEIYDPSHDIWQNTDPVDVIANSDIDRIHRIHVKTTRNIKSQARVDWGGMYPMQSVDSELAKKAGISIPQNSWDRHHYEPMLPGFGGTDNMDWRAFVELLNEKGFNGPYEIENEAKNSMGTGNIAAISQGYKAAISFLSPMLWDLSDKGYQFNYKKELSELQRSDIPVREVKSL